MKEQVRKTKIELLPALSTVHAVSSTGMPHPDLHVQLPRSLLLASSVKEPVVEKQSSGPTQLSACNTCSNILGLKTCIWLGCLLSNQNQIICICCQPTVRSGFKEDLISGKYRPSPADSIFRYDGEQVRLPPPFVTHHHGYEDARAATSLHCPFDGEVLVKKFQGLFGPQVFRKLKPFFMARFYISNILADQV